MKIALPSTCLNNDICSLNPCPWLCYKERLALPASHPKNDRSQSIDAIAHLRKHPHNILTSSSIPSIHPTIHRFFSFVSSKEIQRQTRMQAILPNSVHVLSCLGPSCISLRPRPFIHPSISHMQPSIFYWTKNKKVKIRNRAKQVSQMR